MSGASEVVFDANLWLNIALSVHPFHAQATQLLSDCLASGVEIIAPSLWEIEADSSLRMMRARKEINRRAELAAQGLLNAAPVRVEAVRRGRGKFAHCGEMPEERRRAKDEELKRKAAF